MIRNLNIAAIVENTPATPAVGGEWGLAFWIKADAHRILFDTGQGHTLLQNAHALGIDLSTAQSMVISHGHYDHTGGIAVAMAAGFRGRIYVHPQALRAKFQRLGTSSPRQICIPALSRRALRSRVTDLVKTPSLTEIAPGILVTGKVPRGNRYEDDFGSFFSNAACTQPDILSDDQALLIETWRGWVLITGCGHAGLMNILHYARELTGSSRIFAVIGGLHLFSASGARIRATVACLRDCGVELIAPCHCTGFKAIDRLKRGFQDGVASIQAGLTIQLSAAGSKDSAIPWRVVGRD